MLPKDPRILNALLSCMESLETVTFTMIPTWKQGPMFPAVAQLGLEIPGSFLCEINPLTDCHCRTSSLMPTIHQCSPPQSSSVHSHNLMRISFVLPYSNRLQTDAFYSALEQVIVIRTSKAKVSLEKITLVNFNVSLDGSKTPDRCRLLVEVEMRKDRDIKTSFSGEYLGDSCAGYSYGYYCMYLSIGHRSWSGAYGLVESFQEESLFIMRDDFRHCRYTMEMTRERRPRSR
jgi:hypothetical protein